MAGAGEEAEESGLRVAWCGGGVRDGGRHGCADTKRERNSGTLGNSSSNPGPRPPTQPPTIVVGGDVARGCDGLHQVLLAAVVADHGGAQEGEHLGQADEGAAPAVRAHHRAAHCSWHTQCSRDTNLAEEGGLGEPLDSKPLNSKLLHPRPLSFRPQDSRIHHMGYMVRRTAYITHSVHVENSVEDRA